MRTLIRCWEPARLAAAAMLALAACSDGVTPPGAEVASVTVDPQDATVPLGGTRQLAAHALDANGTEISGLQFAWSSSHEDIISVSSSGLVTSQRAGAATVSATVGGQTGTALIYTGQAVATVVIAPVPLALAVGESTQLIAVLADAQGAPVVGPAVTWTSNDEAVATVSPVGVVTAVATGTATLTATAEGKGGTGTVSVTQAPAPVNSVTVQPSLASVAPGGSVQLTAVTKDLSGNVLPGRAVAWNSSASSVATVSSAGLVIGVTAGNATITATSEGVDGGVQIVVSPASAVASITLSPANAVVVVGTPLQVSATVRDAGGDMLIAHALTWTSSDPVRVMVSQTGLVTGQSPGATVTITAAAEGILGTATITVISPPVVSVTVSPTPVTIGVGGRLRLGFRARDATGGDVPDRAVIWTTSNPSVTTVSPEDADAHGDGIVIGAGAGTATISATTDGVTGTAQVTVAPLRFTAVSVGSYMSCGLTPAGEAFCWGVPGGLGTGDFNGQTTPVSVAGGLSFDQISVGQQHACGLTSAGAVYCWGDDSSGQLGAGSSPSPACAPFQNSIAFCPVPVAVSGGLTFKSVSAGALHTCGLLMDGTAYCWGYNARNQLGATTTETCSFSFSPCSGVPVLVSGGLKFAEISAGYLHTCALSLDHAAYCWGDNNRGEGGNGVSSGSIGTPTAVVGGLTFTSIDAGFQLTCGIVTGGLGYCWGDNEYQQLGSGTPSTNEDTPTSIFGGMTFTKLTAGARAACGVTPAGAGYCWGQNSQGTLGAGDFSDRPLPTPIVGGLTFALIDVGNSLTTCGLTVAQAAYCWGRAAQGTTGTIAPPSYVPTPTRVAGQP